MTKLEELRTTRTTPPEPLAADRRRDRRVPVPVRRERRRDQGDGRLLEDVARRGRSQGIHLVLASQDMSGIQAFWGRPAIFEQFVLRIALPRARRVLVDTNDAALELPRWHAVVNHESGIRHGNEIVRVPDASTAGRSTRCSSDLTGSATPARRPPGVFDGSRSPADRRAVRLPPGDRSAAACSGSASTWPAVPRRSDAARRGATSR